MRLFSTIGGVMRTTSIRLSDEEEAFIRRQMALSGEKDLGPHIKRVYFGKLNPSEGLLPELLQKSEMALAMLAELRRGTGLASPPPADSDAEGDTELRLLAAIFWMLYMSVGSDVKTVIKRYVNPDAVDTYLKAGESEL